MNCSARQRGSLSGWCSRIHTWPAGAPGPSSRRCDELFAKLSAGGSVTMPLQEMFWGAYYGTWTDRFGVNWMVNYTLPTT